ARRVLAARAALSVARRDAPRRRTRARRGRAGRGSGHGGAAQALTSIRGAVAGVVEEVVAGGVVAAGVGEVGIAERAAHVVDAGVTLDAGAGGRALRAWRAHALGETDRLVFAGDGVAGLAGVGAVLREEVAFLIDSRDFT